MSTTTPTSPSTTTNSSTMRYTMIYLFLCILWRTWLANRMPIMDCDEVYNYWEPLHYWLFGSGFQTWEYAHTYALRTYAYLSPLVGVKWMYDQSDILEPYDLHVNTTDVITSLVSFLVDDTPDRVMETAALSSHRFMLFLVVRATLAAVFAHAEVRWCAALQARGIVSASVARWTLFTLQCSAGLAHASGALLPSTTVALFWLWAATCLVKDQPYRFVVYAVTATLAIGWPFGVLVFVPLGLYVLGRVYHQSSGRGLLDLLLFTYVLSTIIQALVLLCDQQHYGDWISATVNIVVYNTHSGGDELYGVEPTSYYVKNALLNFNVVALLGVASAAVLLVGKVLLANHQQQRYQWWCLLVLLSPLYLWLAVVVPRPHKEERFLFPIYPVLCLGAVATMDCGTELAVTLLCHLVGYERATTTPNNHPKQSVSSVWIQWWIRALVLLPAAALSLCRIMALRYYYTAPLTLYAALHSQTNNNSRLLPEVVCVCGEWYRFPSSFTLPDHMELRFLPSSFTGQLPQPFHPTRGSRRHEDQDQTFNDQNRHEPSRYTTLEQCTYLIDLDTSADCPLPPLVSSSSSTTTTNDEQESQDDPRVVATAPFLNADMTTMLHRAFYIPRLHQQALEQDAIQFQNYTLYKL